MSARLMVTAIVTDGDGQRQFTVIGQKAKTLLALVEAGARGVTALEVSSWALRLAAYCHFLQRDHGLSIVCQRENHVGGWHGRHCLISRVTIVRVVGVEKKEAA